MVSETPAASVTVRQVLGLLDGEFSALSCGVADGKYTFWLGSGISRDCVADLTDIITRILVYLRERVETEIPDCPYKSALKRALALARLSDVDMAKIDFAVPVAEWPVIETVLRNLAVEYSTLLDIEVEGHPEPDYLLWEAANFPAMFAEDEVAPDCEHLCLAILSLEGVLPDIATVNWDALIESAVVELSGTTDATLNVCVIPEDLRAERTKTRVLKFHGCASRAISNPDEYRSKLIARRSQITAWQVNADSALMRHELLSLATTKPTFMVGLSAQDENIQWLFARARELMHWNWPENRQAHVFAEDALGENQLSILKVVYGETAQGNMPAIKMDALFRAYAKPALTAMVLHILCLKLGAFLECVEAPSLQDGCRETLVRGIACLRDRLSEAAEPDRTAFIRSLASGMTRALALFQEGRTPADQRYRALSNGAVQGIPLEANLVTSGMREFAAALAVLGANEQLGHWVVDVADLSSPQAGSIELISDAGKTRVFFASNERAGVQLEICGFVNADDKDSIIVHSTSPVERMPRSPVAAPGRVGRAKLRNVSMATILLEAENSEQLCERFRQEVVL